MKFPITLVGAALYLFSSVEAGISTTNPFKGITWNGGETKTIFWQDDGSAPKLQEIGVTTIDLMVGGPQSQFLADNIGQTPATSGKINYVVPKDVGPPGDFYFIKYTAGEYVSFSGSFTIEKVDGVVAGFDPKSPNGQNATTTASDAATTSASPSGDATSSPSATSQDPYAAGGSTPDPNAAASGSASPSSGGSAASGSGKSLPSEISNNDGNNLLPSFVSVVTAAIALTFTYLY